jgi:hypothetical protein
MNKIHFVCGGHVEFEAWYLLIQEKGRRRFWERNFRREMETKRA